MYICTHTLRVNTLTPFPSTFPIEAIKYITKLPCDEFQRLPYHLVVNELCYSCEVRGGLFLFQWIFSCHSDFLQLSQIAAVGDWRRKSRYIHFSFCTWAKRLFCVSAHVLHQGDKSRSSSDLPSALYFHIAPEKKHPF